jgi:catechol 2,3-dioxygenase-like lactoylglutathione lyase family enzyme
MAGFRMFLILLCVVSTPFSGLAQKQKTDVRINLSPYLLAMSVANVDDSVKWYEEKLGFAVVEKMDLPAYNLRIVFMERDGFRLELVEDKKSVSLPSIQCYFPGVNDKTKLQGFTKFSFLTENVEQVSKDLKGKNVSLIMDVTKDEKQKVKFILLHDNSGNLLQFIQKDN